MVVKELMSRIPSFFSPGTQTKALLYPVLALMLVSGAGWLILDNFFEQETQFGLQKHPWQIPLLNLHGFSSYLFTILFGYLIGSHVVVAWKAKRYRNSGLLLLVTIACVIASGASFLFLPVEDIESYLTWVHVVSALALLGTLAWHINFKDRSR